MIQYLKSFFSFSIGTWLRAVISFFSTPVISYLIVPEEFGKAAMFTLVYNIAFIASLMGLDQSFVRHYYQNEEKKNFSGTVYLCPLFLVLLFLLHLFSLSHLSALPFTGKIIRKWGSFFLSLL